MRSERAAEGSIDYIGSSMNARVLGLVVCALALSLWNAGCDDDRKSAPAAKTEPLEPKEPEHFPLPKVLKSVVTGAPAASGSVKPDAGPSDAASDAVAVAPSSSVKKNDAGK